MDLAKTFTQSTVLASAAWSGQTLTITFRRGQTYRYAGVPAQVFMALGKAPSAGRYFHQSIKSSYTGVRVEDPQTQE